MCLVVYMCVPLPLLGVVGCAASSTTSVASDSPPAAAPLAGWTAEGLRVRQVAPKTWVVTDLSLFNANSLVAEMPDGTLLIADTPPTDDATKRLIVGLRKHFGISRTFVAVNGHFHLDASGGNRAIRQAGGQIYASRETAALLAARGDTMRRSLAKMSQGKPAQRWFDDTRIAPPTDTFDQHKGATLKFGGESVQVIYPGEAHSPDNVVVYLPNRSVLFGGCMVIGMKRVGYTGDANLKHWPRAIALLKRLAPKVVIPGHGFRVDPGLLDHTLGLLENYKPSSSRH